MSNNKSISDLQKCTISSIPSHEETNRPNDLFPHEETPNDSSSHEETPNESSSHEETPNDSSSHEETPNDSSSHEEINHSAPNPPLASTTLNGDSIAGSTGRRFEMTFFSEEDPGDVTMTDAPAAASRDSIPTSKRTAKMDPATEEVPGAKKRKLVGISNERGCETGAAGQRRCRDMTIAM